MTYFVKDLINQEINGNDDGDTFKAHWTSFQQQDIQTCVAHATLDRM